MNNELLAVESLISRLARGETADGTPASYDDMLASKLEALSTSVDAGAKARRLGKQSSFERLRRLGKQSSFGRRAASAQAAASPNPDPNPNPDPEPNPNQVREQLPVARPVAHAEATHPGVHGD